MGSAALVQSSDGVVTSQPRPSATMCVLYQGGEDVEVMMVRRSSTARFMAHAWVFPGGVVDVADHEEPALSCITEVAQPELGPWLAAAFREVVEETGLWLTDEPFVELPGDSDVLTTAAARGLSFPAQRTAYFANWVTPTMIPARFDARFFIAALPDRLVPTPDGVEVDAAEFVPPTEALRRGETGEWLVPFPTQRTLHQLTEISSVTATLDEWQRRPVVPVQPRMRIAADGSLEVVMPDEPGFDDLEDVPPDPDVLAKAARAAAQQGRPIAEVPSGRD